MKQWKSLVVRPVVTSIFGTFIVACSGGGGGSTSAGGGSGGGGDTPAPLECSLPVTETPNTWVRVGGPSGGLGYNVRYKADAAATVFVTDAWGGLQKSTDGGETWSPSNIGITSRSGASNDAIPVYSLKIDPNNSEVIWVGLKDGGGVFKSENGGTSFVKKDTGLPLASVNDVPGVSIRHIEIKPGDSDTIYVMGHASTGRKGFEFERTKGFVYRSTDGGDSFTLLKDFDALTRWLFINPSDPDSLLVTTGIFDSEVYVAQVDDVTAHPGLGVFRSTDGGATWTASNTGLSAAKSLYVGGAAAHPQNSNTILIGTGNNAETASHNKFGGVYLSTDGGANWTDVSPKKADGSDYDDNYTAVAFAPSDPNVIYAGSSHAIYRSADLGLNWTRHSSSGDFIWGPQGVIAGFPIDMVVSPTDPQTVYINNYGGGVFRSTDGAKTWSSWSKGYSGADIRSVAVHSKGCLAANGRSGIFRSENGGLDWTGASNGNEVSADGSAVVYDPSDESGRTMLISDSMEGRLLRTTDAGATWSSTSGLKTGLGEVGDRHGLRRVVFAPGDSKIVYAGYLATGVLGDPHNLGVPESYGMYVSSDGGQTWSERNSGLPTGAGARNVTGIAVSHQDPNHVVISLLKGGIYRSLDGGGSWTAVTGSLPAGENWNDEFDPTGLPIPRHSVLSLALDPTDHDRILIGTNAHGVYRTVDGGVNWLKSLDESVMAAIGPKDHAHVTAVAVNPADPLTIYVGDWHSGVYRSTDGGQNWSYFSSSLSTRAVNDLKVSPDGEFVFIGTQGEGVFRLRTGVAATVAALRSERSAEPEILPEPFLVASIKFPDSCGGLHRYEEGRFPGLLR